MSSKKNIDRLFQERFKDFEAAPPMATWDQIEKELDGKKPAAVLPLWIKWIGIAAGIALLATLAYTGYSSISNDTNANQQLVTDTNTQETQKDSKTNSSIIDDSSNNQLVDDEKKTNSIFDKSSNENLIENNDAVVVNKEYSNNSITTSSQKRKNVNKVINSSQESRISDKSTITNNPYASSTNLNKNSNLSNSNSSNKDATKKRSQPVSNRKKTDFALNQSLENPTSQSENLDGSNTSQAPNKKTTSPLNNTPQFMTPSASNIDMAAAQVDKDTTLTSGPSLEDMAAQQEKEDEDEKIDALPFKKWNASSVLAPVYSSTLGGSSIDQQFADNNKSAGVNLSYGVNVGYNLSSRLSVRTGIHKMNLSYTTNDIIYGIATQPGDVQLLSVGSFDRNAVSNPGNISTDNIGSSFSQEFLSDNTFGGFQGEISQRLGYLEVPLELKYKLLDSKLSVNVMGGMSALFLTDNSIAVTNNTAKLELGEDKNFNTFNQSANFGLGIDYLFTDQLAITVEPMFKYQLNALKENTAGFKPFNVGVYSGITYKF